MEEAKFIEYQNYVIFSGVHDNKINILEHQEIAIDRIDSFEYALKMYMKTRNINVRKLAQLTGWNPCSVSRYCSGKREMKWENLCVICIALRIPPYQQRHLFSLSHLVMPDGGITHDTREYIIRSFLDGCAYAKEYTLEKCNEMLKEHGFKMLCEAGQGE